MSKQSCYNPSLKSTETFNIPTTNLSESLCTDDSLAWEETLEESLNEPNYLLFMYPHMVVEKLIEALHTRYHVGDIIMCKRLTRDDGEVVDNSPHRILVVTKKTISEDEVTYEGYELSSQVSKSNYNSNYDNRIYVKSYSSMLKDRYNYSNSSECYVNVENLYKSSSNDIEGNAYKGHVSSKFWHFIDRCRQNYLSGTSNKNRYWLEDNTINEEFVSENEYEIIYATDANQNILSVNDAIENFILSNDYLDDSLRWRLQSLLQKFVDKFIYAHLGIETDIYRYAFTKQFIDSNMTLIEEIKNILKCHSSYRIHIDKIIPENIVYSDDDKLIYLKLEYREDVNI